MAVAVGADPSTALSEARRVLATNRYLTLATADADGRPWPTPVWFAIRDDREFVWISRPGARHSLNIAARPDVGIAVFDSSVPVGSAAAVYAEAVAAEVTPDSLPDALAVFNARAGEQGIGTWNEPDVTTPSEFRLYRARIARLYVLDEHDGRRECR